MAERLQKYLARSGTASRRGAEVLIRAGRVACNGTVVLDPASPVAAGDSVLVDGRVVCPAPQRSYALHKPSGYLSTVNDPQGRPTVLDLVPKGTGRLYPVGRLDAASEGLLLLTNDGELCHALTHPRHGIAKRYHVLCDRAPGQAEIGALARGVRLADGPTRPAEVRRLRDGWMEVVLREGRNRQVRRMCAAVGLDVRRLVRVAIGGLALGDLPPGGCRRLTEDEVGRLLGAPSGSGRKAGGDRVID